MVPVLLVALLAGLAGGTLPAEGLDDQEAPRVCVVANLGGDVDEIDPEALRRVFLLRQRFWPDGSAAHPVNLPPSSALRQRFSQVVFGQTVRQMAPYWNERYFHGTRPPPTLASEAAVLLFLQRTPGGVGYVSEDLTEDLPGGVRVLRCLP